MPLFLTFVFLFTGQSYGALRIAVASNFVSPMKVIAERFENESETPCEVISGSTGKLFAQIIHGAPFDLFFAADQKRPEELIKRKKAIADSQMTYATGRLVLWPADPKKGLGQIKKNRLAIANPKLAPYGRAAEEVLKKKELFEVLKSQLVFGENISQTFLFVDSKNAPMGLVAFSQIDPLEPHFKIPKSWHRPIRQDAVLLKESKTGREFLNFLKSSEMRQLVRGFGYE